MRHLLLLHGAIGSKTQLESLARVLDEHFKVHTLNFTGHGGNPLPKEPFSIPLFSNDILRYLDINNIPSCSIFGYSMGGYAAMHLAKTNSLRIEKLITLATKFQWDEAISAHEVKMLDDRKIEEKLPAFAEQLKERHAPTDWKELLGKTRELLINLGKDNTLKVTDYEQISIPSLILLGDNDKMVSLEETVRVQKLLPASQLGIMPGTPHPIEQVDMNLLAFLLKRFLN